MQRRKTAVITGSTSGIGLATAHRLAAEGCDIIVNSFTDTQADRAIAEEIAGRHKVGAVYVKADMAKAADCRDLVAAAAEAFGSVDILVNNAGIQHVAPVESFPPEKWDAIIAVNLTSAFHTTAAAIPLMKKAGWGRIVNIASAHGLVASPFKSAYVAAKHGVVGFTKSVALELAETGVTCNAICPGYVRTPLVEGQVADQAKVHNMSDADVIRNVILAVQPTKRVVETCEIGSVAEFLASDDARSITGAALSVDGGWTTR